MCRYAQSYLEISRSDLAENARLVTGFVKCPVIGVVKCDGYGVSLAEAAAAWVSAGVTRLAVSEPQEALALRRLGFAGVEILLLSPAVCPETLEALIAARVTLTVTGPDCARRYAAAAAGRTVRVHVAVDTGMGRFGLHWRDLAAIEEVYQTRGLTFTGIFSHFAASFARSDRLTRQQLERFLSVTHALAAKGYPVGLRHIANSCAALRWPETWLDAVRVGSALVGRLPVTVSLPLRRVGVYRAMVVERRTLHAGDTTGYASLCRVRRETEVAVLSLGRHSGFGLVKRPETLRPLDFLANQLRLLRGCLHRPSVEYCGRTLPVVGRIGSQFTLVDAGGTDLAPGDYVTAPVDLMLTPPERRFV